MWAGGVVSAVNATHKVAALPVRLGNNFNVGQQQKLHFIFGSWCVQLVARARACCRHFNVSLFFFVQPPTNHSYATYA